MESQFLYFAHKMSKYCHANSGNISIRTKEGLILTTPTNTPKDILTKDMLVSVDIEGNQKTGSLNPSSELKMHLYIYKKRPDVMAIVHTHPLYATLCTLKHQIPNTDLLAESSMLLGDIALCDYAKPSTEDLALSTSPYIDKCNVFLLKNHGAVTIGSDLNIAVQRMEALEFLSKICILGENCKLFALSKKDAEKLKN